MYTFLINNAPNNMSIDKLPWTVQLLILSNTPDKYLMTVFDLEVWEIQPLMKKGANKQCLLDIPAQ